MARPRLEGMEEVILQQMVKRGVYKSTREALSAAVKLLFREQARKDAEQVGSESGRDETIDMMQFETANAK